MKILLIGEYSSLHKNLKEGLEEIGHSAIVAASSDGFKKIPVDICFDSNLPSLLGKVKTRINAFTSLIGFRGYDVVQLINPFFTGRFFPYRTCIDLLSRNNATLSLLAAGDDAFFWTYARHQLRYGPFNDFLKYDLMKKDFFMNTPAALAYNKYVANAANVIIPVMHEYAIGYSSYSKATPIIPLPCNVKNIPYTCNDAAGKLVIFHGLNRYGFKGTRHVEEAFSYLSNKYSSDVECVIAGKLPLSEYLKIMERANVVIDQVNSYSLGLNAIYALAMGKVVLGGAEPDGLKSMNILETPVINILPTASSIIESVERIIAEKSRIEEIGLQGRRYVEQYHDHVVVAKQYIAAWSNHLA